MSREVALEQCRRVAEVTKRPTLGVMINWADGQYLPPIVEIQGPVTRDHVANGGAEDVFNCWEPEEL